MALKNKNMNLILTMAGEYSRFKNKGFKIPKFLLPWGNRNILSEILHEMSSHFDNVYLIMNEKDKDYKVHIQNIMGKYKIKTNNLISITDTKSQSETVYKGLELIGNIDGPIIIHNIDTILYNRNYNTVKSKLTDNEGFIDIFLSNNPIYSYVIIDKNKIKEIAEKILISNTATSGMYGFSSVSLFKKYYKKGYISDIYKNMINESLSITTGIRYNELNTVVLGTPDEYMNLSKIHLKV